MKESEKSNSMIMLEELMDAGYVPENIVLVNTKEKEEVIYTVEDDEKREEYLKDIPFGD